jgi:glucokinase
MKQSDSIYLGIDIGGTKIAAGLVNGDGDVLYKTRVPMISNRDAATGFAAVREAIDTTMSANPDRSIAGIGICSPGPLDPRTGVVINPPNLPCWRDFALADEVNRAYELPTKVDNDANAAGLAETIWGAAKGYDEVFYATLGTGIGTGIILNGKIFHGRTGAAAEGGHMSIDYRGPRCGCGKMGCIEALASGPAIALRARNKLSETKTSSKMVDLAGGNVSAVTTEIVAAAWRDGDTTATEVLRETADLLAIWLGNIIDLLEPKIIVVGGGIGELASHWFDHIHEQLPKWSINQRCNEIPLKLARYNADAGLAGAAALCLSGATVAVVA